MSYKRLLRSRSIFICLIILFIVYVGLNNYFLNLVGLQTDNERLNPSQKRDKLNQIPKQIVNI